MCLEHHADALDLRGDLFDGIGRVDLNYFRYKIFVQYRNRLQNIFQIRKSFRMIFEEEKDKFTFDQLCLFLYGQGTIASFKQRVVMLKVSYQVADLLATAFNDIKQFVSFEGFEKVLRKFVIEMKGSVIK